MTDLVPVDLNLDGPAMDAAVLTWVRDFDTAEGLKRLEIVDRIRKQLNLSERQVLAIRKGQLALCADAARAKVATSLGSPSSAIVLIAKAFTSHPAWYDRAVNDVGEYFDAWTYAPSVGVMRRLVTGNPTERDEILIPELAAAARERDLAERRRWNATGDEVARRTLTYMLDDAVAELDRAGEVDLTALAETHLDADMAPLDRAFIAFVKHRLLTDRWNSHFVQAVTDVYGHQIVTTMRTLGDMRALNERQRVHITRVLGRNRQVRHALRPFKDQPDTQAVSWSEVLAAMNPDEVDEGDDDDG